jgi:prophage regulatory protein
MRLVSFQELNPRYGIKYCRVHLMRKVSAGEFPQPVRISDRRIAWLESDVAAWIAAIAERRAA